MVNGYGSTLFKLQNFLSKWLRVLNWDFMDRLLRFSLPTLLVKWLCVRLCVFASCICCAFFSRYISVVLFWGFLWRSFYALRKLPLVDPKKKLPLIVQFTSISRYLPTCVSFKILLVLLKDIYRNIKIFPYVNEMLIS